MVTQRPVPEIGRDLLALVDYVDSMPTVAFCPMLIAAMPLAKKSNLKVKSLKQILALTGGVTSRIFSLVKDLSIDAIVTGEECITDARERVSGPEPFPHSGASR